MDVEFEVRRIYSVYYHVILFHCDQFIASLHEREFVSRKELSGFLEGLLDEEQDARKKLKDSLADIVGMGVIETLPMEFRMSSGSKCWCLACREFLEKVPWYCRPVILRLSMVLNSFSTRIQECFEWRDSTVVEVGWTLCEVQVGWRKNSRRYKELPFFDEWISENHPKWLCEFGRS